MGDLLLRGQVAIVTGASGGIGRAMALGLGARGASLCLVGRRKEILESVAASAGADAGRILCYPVDLVSDDLASLKEAVSGEFGRADLLVHSAGVLANGPLAEVSAATLGLLYETNVRAPYQLTQLFLPLLVAQQGQVVFINSSAGLAARANVGQYSATKHALKAIADSLREEVNPLGVRVLSVYPGRVATPMQETLHAREGKPYRAELLLQPEDVASVITHALTLPRTAEVTDIQIRPMHKS